MKLIRYTHPQSTSANALDHFLGLGSAHFGRFDHFFDEFLGRRNDVRVHEPAVDLYEDTENYYARAELPGVKKDQIDLRLEDSVLTIQSVKSEKTEEGEGHSSFARSVSIPDGVVVDKVSADYEDGVLTVTIPKEAARKPRQITIK